MVARVSGVVQGVQAPSQGPASSLRGVGGRRGPSADGDVEVVFEGAEAAVREAVEALGGPRAPGEVAAVHQRDEPAQGVRGFTTE